LIGYLGKANRSYLDNVIYPRLGASRREIIVGPRFGVDNAVVRVGREKVLVATTDPLSFIPGLRPSESAWLSVNLLASDLTTCGSAPQYGIFDFNLPPEMRGHQFAEYWKAFHAECKKLGLGIVGGHTGKYQGCGYSIIGGGVMCTFCHEDRYLTSEMATTGDNLILTKGAAIETTGVLARAFPRTIKRALGTKMFDRARSYLCKVSTVKDALTAASIGLHGDGVTAMHDATEGGIIGAVLELASASRVGVEIDLDEVHISEETLMICKLFRINPLTSLSEGALVIASPPHKTSKVLNKLRSVGIPSRVIGRLRKTRSAKAITKRGQFSLKYPRFDPYWKAYRKGTMKGWR
jgi:hydrogenase expression/formation protein HypE